MFTRSQGPCLCKWISGSSTRPWIQRDLHTRQMGFGTDVHHQAPNAALLLKKARFHAWHRPMEQAHDTFMSNNFLSQRGNFLLRNARALVTQPFANEQNHLPSIHAWHNEHTKRHKLQRVCA